LDTTTHDLTTLFDQLGLASDASSIDAFIGTHRPLAARVRLVEAPFWNAGQRAFLDEALSDDSDWAERVDELDARLR